MWWIRLLIGERNAPDADWCTTVREMRRGE